MQKKYIPIIVATILSIVGIFAYTILVNRGVTSLRESVSDWKSTILSMVVLSAVLIDFVTVKFFFRMRKLGEM